MQRKKKLVVHIIMAYCTPLLLFPFVLTLFWVIMPGKLNDPTCPVYLICSKFWNSNGPIRLYDYFWDGGRFSVFVYIGMQLVYKVKHSTAS